MTLAAFGSGNVFEDLNLLNPDLRLAKADLASAIALEVEDRSLTLEEASRIGEVSADEMSLVMGGRLTGFDAGRLQHILDRFQRSL
jgi:predicted XRE-type DNA-binding protein